MPLSAPSRPAFSPFDSRALAAEYLADPSCPLTPMIWSWMVVGMEFQTSLFIAMTQQR